MQGATLIFPVVGYFNSLSILAQASATLRFCASVPANVAQPPFSINESCFHESISFSSAKVALASVARWNLSTQIGARAATPTGACRCTTLAVGPDRLAGFLDLYGVRHTTKHAHAHRLDWAFVRDPYTRAALNALNNE
jgi:hypothetical protein